MTTWTSMAAAAMRPSAAPSTSARTLMVAASPPAARLHVAAMRPLPLRTAAAPAHRSPRRSITGYTEEEYKVLLPGLGVSIAAMVVWGYIRLFVVEEWLEETRKVRG